MLNKSQSTSSLLRLATYASVVTAMTLIAAKFVAWLVTGSVSVLASLIDSLMDAAASLINLFAVRYSLMPADGEHRFGHGKAESLAGLAQATFIAGSAVFLILHATERLQHPRALQNVSVAISVMAFSVIATLVLVGIQRYVIQRTGSTAIRADSLHYMSDLLTNVSIIVALVLAVYGWPGLDPVFAIGVASSFSTVPGTSGLKPSINSWIVSCPQRSEIASSRLRYRIRRCLGFMIFVRVNLGARRSSSFMSNSTRSYHWPKHTPLPTRWTRRSVKRFPTPTSSFTRIRFHRRNAPSVNMVVEFNR